MGSFVVWCVDSVQFMSAKVESMKEIVGAIGAIHVEYISLGPEFGIKDHISLSGSLFKFSFYVWFFLL